MGKSPVVTSELKTVDKAILCLLRDKGNAPMRLIDIQQKIKESPVDAPEQLPYYLTRLKTWGLLEKDNTKKYTLSGDGQEVAEDLPKTFFSELDLEKKKVFDLPHLLRSQADPTYKSTERSHVPWVPRTLNYPMVPKTPTQIDTLLGAAHTAASKREHRVFICSLFTLVRLRMYTHPMQGFGEWVMAQWVEKIRQSCHFTRTVRIPYQHMVKASGILRRTRPAFALDRLRACYSGRDPWRVDPRMVESLTTKLWHMAPFKSTCTPQSLFSSFLEETMPDVRECIATEDIDATGGDINFQHPIPEASFSVLTLAGGVKIPIVAINTREYLHMLKDWVADGEFDYIAEHNQKKLLSRIYLGLYNGITKFVGRDRASAFEKNAPTLSAMGSFEVGFPILKGAWITPP